MMDHLFDISEDIRPAATPSISAPVPLSLAPGLVPCKKGCVSPPPHSLITSNWTAITEYYASSPLTQLYRIKLLLKSSVMVVVWYVGLFVLSILSPIAI